MRKRNYNSDLTERCREMRKNMTRQERHLWYDYLRFYPVKIYRQRVIGSYIVDFYCARALLAIEADGDQHHSDSNWEYDLRRSFYLRKCGIKVIRFSNREINTNFDHVCRSIDNEIRQRLEIAI